MAKGAKAREFVTNKIVSALDGAFVDNKKIYAWVDDGGEQVQICIALTIPKTPVEGGSYNANINDWGDDPMPKAATTPAPQVTKTATEPSEDDKAKIVRLMASLGL